MGSFSIFGMLLYVGIVFGVGIYVLVLLTQLVSAHKRCASALERIAEKSSGQAS